MDVWNPLIWIALSFTILIGVIFIGWALYIIAQRRKYRHIPSPPLSGFWSGHVNLILESRARSKPPIDAVALEWFQKLETDIIVLFAYHVVFVVVYGPEKTKIMLQSKYPKPPELVKLVQYPCQERYCGSSMATTSSYEDWKPKRNAFNPIFNKTNLKNFVPKINSCVDKFLWNLEEKANLGCSFSLHEELLKFALQVVANTVLGLPLDFLNKDSYILQGLEEIGDMIASNAINPLFRFLPWQWRFISKTKKRIRQLRAVLKEIVIEKRKTIDTADEDTIFTALLKTSSQDSSITLDDIVDELVAFLLAGHETTGNTMAFLATEVFYHKSIEQKLVKELDALLGEKCEVSTEDLPKLVFLSQVIKETTRLHSVILNSQRLTSSDIQMGNIKVPKGTTVWVSLYSNSHHPAFWKKPNEFIPERFEDESKEGCSSFFTPFSGGPRNCIGQHLATMEMKILIARLLQRFHFELEPNQHGKYIPNLALTPYGGTRGRLIHRSCHQKGQKF